MPKIAVPMVRNVSNELMNSFVETDLNIIESVTRLLLYSMSYMIASR